MDETTSMSWPTRNATMNRHGPQSLPENDGVAFWMSGTPRPLLTSTQNVGRREGNGHVRGNERIGDEGNPRSTR